LGILIIYLYMVLFVIKHVGKVLYVFQLFTDCWSFIYVLLFVFFYAVMNYNVSVCYLCK